MRNIHKSVLSEIQQTTETRRKLFRSIEKHLGGRKLITLFTSFNWPVDLSDDDCDMLQGVLQENDLGSGLALMISSPGGDGLAAERIVNACKAYSGTGDYWVIVPGKAKSAATIICMGAAKIWMAASSELGPVDPQIFRTENGVRRVFSAHNLVTAYEKLFAEATQAQGPLEPYLQQLQYYDSREIATYQSLIDLSEDISIKILKDGMLKGKKNADIKKRMEIFLNPAAGTLTHGRPIFASEAKSCGLNVVDMNVNSALWRDIYELYARTERFSFQACKCIESLKESFYASPPQ